MGLVKMTLLITTRWKETIIKMNKDAKLLAEAYEDIQFTQRKKPFLEKPGRLNPTSDLEKIADFLNSNEVYSGSPVKGSGGWFVSGDAVHNDDAEGGQYLSVRIVPDKKGLIVIDSDGIKVQYSWPVEAKYLNQRLPTYK